MVEQADGSGEYSKVVKALQILDTEDEVKRRVFW